MTRHKHWWAAQNGWRCVVCRKWRWELRATSKDYRPQPVVAA